MSVDLRSDMTRRDALFASTAALGLPLLGAGAAHAAPQSEAAAYGLGRDQNFDRGWRFFRGEGSGFERPDVADGDWRAVDLPHDWSIEDLPAAEGSGRVGPFDPKAVGGTATGFTVGGEGWYRKRFSLEALPPGAQAQVEFGGVYRESDVWLNGQHLGRRVHGYTPFAYDLTPHLGPGENILAVRVRNQGKNSRWYSGSGIYRSVTLDVLPEPAHVQRWGVAVTTRRIGDEAAEIVIDTRLDGEAAGLTLTSRIRDKGGRLVAEASSPAAQAVRQVVNLPKPELWSPDTPTLYSLETELRRNAVVVDRVSTPFGVRVVTFDAEQGMQINGAAVKLRGGCVHHDNGLLGAAAYPDAEDRRVRLLKARGFNAIRSSHNPSSRAFLDACDRHGMLLIEEAFDMWRTPKNPQDYANDFAEHWKADLTAMVLSARNHPSVIMWSIGNEVPHRSTPEGVKTGWELANAVRRLDPTRPVTAAINGFAGRPVIPDEATARKGFAGVADESAAVFLDVVGYNYKTDRYAADHARFPKRIIYGSESFPKEVFDAWAFIDSHPYVIGDFVWAAMDYLGEAGLGGVTRNTSKIGMPNPPAWPWVVSNLGDLDLTGRQKPQSLARDVVWGVSPLEMAVLRPMPAGTYEHPTPWGWSDELQSWTWPGAEGQPLTVRLYARADRVQLLLNGQSAADVSVSPASKLPIELKVPYAPGELQAVAYRDGREVGRRRLVTAGSPAKLRLTPEPRQGAQRLTYVWVEVTDENGRVVPEAAVKVSLDVNGPAKLVAFGSANPLARGGVQSRSTQTFNGRALAILKSDGRAGEVRLLATGENALAGRGSFRLSA